MAEPTRTDPPAVPADEPTVPVDESAASADRIVVCACTYRRPEGLAALLDSFRALRFPSGAEVEFCIVDNDTAPSSRELVEAAAADFPRPLRHVHEERPGIPSARNRALAEAAGGDFAVFVDDDETVDRRWLVELHRVAKATGAAFVQGPVRMLAEEADDRWWLDTALFRQKVFPDRAPRHESWTNNVMVDTRFVERAGCRFDDALRFDGGSDTLFFQDLVRAGGTGAFAAHALVFEVQPKSRLRWRWAVQRQYRLGTTRANTVTLRESRPRALLYCLVRGAGMGAWGLACLAGALVRGRAGVADGAAYLARASGVLLGAFGVRKLEYAREPGGTNGSGA